MFCPRNGQHCSVFYDFPIEHWAHIRTTNPIFATFRHRTTRTKNCVSRNTLLGLVFPLALAAEKSWLKLRGFNHLPDGARDKAVNQHAKLTWESGKSTLKSCHTCIVQSSGIFTGVTLGAIATDANCPYT